jgi:hypothetical protein
MPPSPSREHKHRFGGLKLSSRLKLPGKVKGIDPKLRPTPIIGIAFGQAKKVPAIDEIETVDGSVIFIRIRSRQREKRIVLMAA